MDFQSSLVIITWIGVFIALVIILIIVFYKPARKFQVVADFQKASQDEPGPHISFSVKNIGKINDQIFTAFMKCLSDSENPMFDLRDKVKKHRLPIALKIGEEVDFVVPWDILKRKLESKSINPRQFKIIIENSVGMEFVSKTIDLPHM